MERRSPLVGSLVVIFAGCLFAMLGVLSRWSFDAGMSPFTFVTWRSGVAALAMVALVLFSLRRGGRLVGWRSLSWRDRAALGVAALMGASLDVTMFLAYSRVSVAIVLLCFYMFPAMVAGASALLGWERLDRVRGVALVVALVGMVAVVVGGPGLGVAGGIDLIGVALALGSALSQAVFVLVARRGYRQVPAEQAMVVILGVSTAIATSLALVGGTLATALLPFESPDLLGLMLFAGVFAAGLPSLLFLVGIRWIGGVRTGILMLAQAPVGVILAALFLHEAIGPIQVLGGVAILAAAVIIQRSAASVQKGAPAANRSATSEA
jgi:drug/metabolite transporter (DMT)-like permease